MKDYRSLINANKVPRHVAIIMDGDRRWAEKKGLPGIEGHRKGTERIEAVTECAHELGVKVLSLYTFSTENWSRSKSEIKGLFQLINYYIKNRKDYLISQGAKIRFCGFYEKLPRPLIKSIEEILKSTEKNNKITLNLCFNYGGRQEIVNAVNKWNDAKKPGEKMSVKTMGKYLLTEGLPEIDLMIRTSGELRLSNFLIWQNAYSEFYFTDVLWPDFSPNHFCKAIYEFQNRKRRFGA